MNGWLLVRIAGIVVGVATLLRLATMQGLVTYDPIFQEWMNRLQDVVELGWIIDIIQLALSSMLDYARSIGIQVPQLDALWRPVFVLLSLVLGSFLRSYWGYGFWGWVVAFSSALTGGTVAGLSGGLGPLGGFAVGVGLFFTYILARSAYGNWIVVRRNPAAANGRLAVRAFAYSIAFLFFSAFAATTTFLVDVPRSGIWLGAALIGVVIIAFYFVYEHLKSSYDWRRSDNSEGTPKKLYPRNSLYVGLDIMAVLLGALGIASLFANPPIW